MKLREYRVADIISLVRRPVALAPDERYTEIGLRSFGKGVFHKHPILGKEIGEKKTFYIRGGDLIFSTVFAWEGAVALATEREIGTIGSHRFMTYQVNTEVADPRFLYYHFAYGPGIDAIRAASPGSAGRNRTLGIKAFANQVVRLPGLLEQQRLAGKLDALLYRVEAIADLRRRSAELLNGVRESLVRRMTEGARDNVCLGDVLVLERTPIVVDPDEIYQVVGIRSFGKGLIHHSPNRGDELSKLNFFRFPAGALVLSNLMAWEGGIAVSRSTDTEYIASNRFLFYVPIKRHRVNVSYLRHFFLTQPGLDLIGTACSSGAERNRTLGRRRFEALQVSLPSHDQQDRAARVLDSLHERVGRAHADPALDALRPSILNAAFTGQL